MSADILYTTPATMEIPPDDPLTRLVRRLEAATSRLEDIASSSGTIEQQANGSISAASGADMPTSSSMPDLQKGGSREASTGTVIRSAHEKDDEDDETASKGPQKEELPERIQEMDELIEKQVQEFVDAGKALENSLVSDQVCCVALMERTWKLTRYVGLRGSESFWSSTAVLIRFNEMQEA